MKSVRIFQCCKCAFCLKMTPFWMETSSLLKPPTSCRTPISVPLCVYSIASLFLRFVFFLCIFWCAKPQNSSDSRGLTQLRNFEKVKDRFILQNYILWTFLSTVFYHQRIFEFVRAWTHILFLVHAKEMMHSIKIHENTISPILK